MLFTVRPCPLCLPQPLLWPRRPGSGHGSHVGGGGSGGGTGVNTAGAGGGAGGGSGGAPASAGGGGGSSAAASAGGGGGSAASAGGGGGGSAADCSQKFVIVSFLHQIHGCMRLETRFIIRILRYLSNR